MGPTDERSVDGIDEEEDDDEDEDEDRPRRRDDWRRDDRNGSLLVFVVLVRVRVGGGKGGARGEIRDVPDTPESPCKSNRLCRSACFSSRMDGTMLRTKGRESDDD